MLSGSADSNQAPPKDTAKELQQAREEQNHLDLNNDPAILNSSEKKKD